MAELVTIEGQQFKRREPWGVWGLTLITLGIYGFVWYNKINNEARRYLQDETIKPGIAVLAVVLGWLLIVPPFISYYRTGERIVRMQERSATSSRLIPILGLIAALVVVLHTVYMQSELNKVWDAARAAGGAGLAPGWTGPPPVPPPPGPAG